MAPHQRILSPCGRVCAWACLGMSSHYRVVKDEVSVDGVCVAGRGECSGSSHHAEEPRRRHAIINIFLWMLMLTGGGRRRRQEGGGSGTGRGRREWRRDGRPRSLHACGLACGIGGAISKWEGRRKTIILASDLGVIPAYNFRLHHPPPHHYFLKSDRLLPDRDVTIQHGPRSRLRKLRYGRTKK